MGSPIAKAHANEMWQADTLYGPFVKINGVPVQTRLIAFLDNASRVCCHGQFLISSVARTVLCVAIACAGKHFK